jgi:hypothetical protein
MKQCVLAVHYCGCHHKRNTGGGGRGGAKLTMGIRNFILQRSQIWKRGKLVPWNTSFSFSFFSLYCLLAIVQFNNQMNYSSVEKILEGGISPLASPQITPMAVIMLVRFTVSCMCLCIKSLQTDSIHSCSLFRLILPSYILPTRRHKPEGQTVNAHRRENHTV